MRQKRKVPEHRKARGQGKPDERTDAQYLKHGPKHLAAVVLPDLQ